MPCFSTIQSISASHRSRDRPERRMIAVEWQAVQAAKVSSRP